MCEPCITGVFGGCDQSVLVVDGNVLYGKRLGLRLEIYVLRVIEVYGLTHELHFFGKISFASIGQTVDESIAFS